MPAAGVGAIDLQRDLAQTLAIFSQLSFNGVAALGCFAMLGFQLLHGFGAVLHVFGKRVQLGIEFGALMFNRGELAGQHHTQLRAHLVAQPGIAFCL